MNHACYELSALQVQVQLLRLELLAKANFDPAQPRVPRGNRDGGRWTRVGGGSAATRTGTDTTGVREPPPRSGTETTILPGDRRVVRDRSGTEPWEAYFETLRPDGSVAERFVVNRDGSGIRSQYATTPELTGWDESHTIIGAGGELATFQNLGKTQTIVDGTGQIIQVASWTNSGPEIEYLRPDLGFDGPSVDGDLGLVGGAGLLGLALGLYAWFASTASPDQAAVFAFRAREYREPREATALVPSYVGRIERDEVEAACPGLAKVQELTDLAAQMAGPKASYRSPGAYGTAVHIRLRDMVRSLPAREVPVGSTFLAEQSLMKTADEAPGVLGSIRVDVLEQTLDETVCVYDIKTGRKTLKKGRATEIADRVYRNYPGTQRIIVTEVRPTR
jgi:hypothetical protein